MGPQYVYKIFRMIKIFYNSNRGKAMANYP